MADVDVVPVGDGAYRIVVSEPNGSTTHHVTASPAVVTRLGADAAGREVVEASFRFLLDREPKESIMSRFDLTVISRYFPEYPAQLAEYLQP